MFSDIANLHAEDGVIAEAVPMRRGKIRGAANVVPSTRSRHTEDTGTVFVSTANLCQSHRVSRHEKRFTT